MSWDSYSENIRAMGFKAGGVYDFSGNKWTEFCDDVSALYRRLRDTECHRQLTVNPPVNVPQYFVLHV